MLYMLRKCCKLPEIVADFWNCRRSPEKYYEWCESDVVSVDVEDCLETEIG